MVDRLPEKRRQLDSTFALEKKFDGEAVAEVLLRPRPPISIAEIAGGNLPVRPSITKNADVYESIGRSPMQMYRVERGGKDAEYMLVGPKLTARDLNSLLYFAAPDKTFGLDTGDILSDWTNLFDPTDSDQVRRLKGHQTMPGWKEFEGHRVGILEFIGRNYPKGPFKFTQSEFTQRDVNDVVIPVLRWRNNENGERAIILDPIDEPLHTAISQTLPAEVRESAMVDSAMGVILAAAYSPGNTNWAVIDGYKHKDTEHTQSIGATQVLAYALRKVKEKQLPADPKKPDPVPDHHDIQKSPLLSGLERYSDEGQVSPVVLGDEPAKYPYFKTYASESTMPAAAYETYIQEMMDAVQKDFGETYVPIDEVDVYGELSTPGTNDHAEKEETVKNTTHVVYEQVNSKAYGKGGTEKTSDTLNQQNGFTITEFIKNFKGNK